MWEENGFSGCAGDSVVYFLVTQEVKLLIFPPVASRAEVNGSPLWGCGIAAIAAPAHRTRWGSRDRGPGSSLSGCWVMVPGQRQGDLTGLGVRSRSPARGGHV